ncbi:VOC family protein, partial [Streptomyces griseus]|uniref:VOC family protein n=1 Tax=Streptomyces griseus TaxID=1911 RepID=UPI0033F1E7A7
MIADLECVVLDCRDPRELAGFYASLLGGEVDRPDRRWGCDADWSTLHTPGGLVLAFQRVADHLPLRPQLPPITPPSTLLPPPRTRHEDPTA